MLFLAAIMSAGIATSSAHAQAHGTFPHPAVPPKGNAVTNMLRAQEKNKEQQYACSRLKLHRLSQNGPAPQALPRCPTGPGTP